MAYTTICAIQAQMSQNRNDWKGKVFSLRVLVSASLDKNGKGTCSIFMLKKLPIDMFDPISRIISTIAHRILVGITSISATTFGTIANKRLRLRVRRHDAFAVAHGTAFSSLLIFLPYPSAPRLLRLGELGRGLVELLALGSHRHSVHDNAS